MDTPGNGRLAHEIDLDLFGFGIGINRPHGRPIPRAEPYPTLSLTAAGNDDISFRRPDDA